MVSYAYYSPSHIKLPEHITKDLTAKEYSNQLWCKNNITGYDDYSLFYDVYFDLNRNYIWTVGPPLFSLEKEIVSVKILYKGKSLNYTLNKQPYCFVKNYHYFQIEANEIQESNPTLTFEFKTFTVNAKVKTFPSFPAKNTKVIKPLTLSVLQLDYSVDHIISWILWHYRTAGITRFLFYDNNSKNAKEVQEALQSIDEKYLEIIFISWPYYYGRHPKFCDLFAQSCQLNHTLRIHYSQDYCICNWDLDEFLVCVDKNVFQKYANIFAYLPLEKYNVIETTSQPVTKISQCMVRNLSSEGPKFFYHSNYIKHVATPHFIRKNDFYEGMYTEAKKIPSIEIPSISESKYRLLLSKLKYKVLKLFFWKSKAFISLSSLKDFKEKHYLIHTVPFKILWKVKRHRPSVEFDPSIHIRDKNIINCIKKADLY